MVNRECQRGSVFFYILIGIVLFAAVSYAVSRSINLGAGDTSMVQEEKARLEVTQILDFSRNLQGGVQEMKLSGIAASAIDFMLPSDLAFDTAPVNAKIFHSGGGKITYVPVWATLDDKTEATATSWAFVRNAIDGVGGSGNEIILALIRVPENVCQSLNKQLTGSATIPNQVGDMVNMFETGVDAVSAANCASCVSVPSLCVRNGNLRVFYSVLDRG